MDDLRDKYNSGESQAREAFEELCAMAIALEVIKFVFCLKHWYGRYLNLVHKSIMFTKSEYRDSPVSAVSISVVPDLVRFTNRTK